MTQTEAEIYAEAFNKRYPRGTKVWYYPARRSSRIETRTYSDCFVEHSVPVIKLEGITGTVAITQIRLLD